MVQRSRSPVSPKDGGQSFAFGPFVLDRVAGVLLKDGTPVPIGARGIRLLETLMSRPGEIIRKADLVDAGWPGLAIEESNLSVQIALLRKAIASSPAGRGRIETIPRVGYRFKGDTFPGGRMDRAVTLALLPFVAVGKDPDLDLFADGLCDELTDALSRTARFTVTARSSSSAYKGIAVDVRQIAADLGVRYVLEGSVRQAGGRLRIATGLVDGDAGSRIWSERFDRTMTDMLSIQDDLSRRIVAGLVSVLAPAGADLWPTMPTRGTSSAEAHRHFVQGRVLQRSAIRSEAMHERYTDLFRQAIALDETYAAPYAALAMAATHAFYHGWGDDPVGSIRRAYSLADEAIARDPDDPFIRGVAALVAMYDRNLERWSTEVERALALDGNFAPALALRAPLAICSGRPDSAISDLQRAIRLDPLFTHQYLHDLGVAQLLAGTYEAAVGSLRERILLVPDSCETRAYLASALGNLGLIEEARGVWAEIASRRADYRLTDRISRLPFRRSGDLERIARGLARADLPKPAFMDP